jgi:hypothetical protein
MNLAINHANIIFSKTYLFPSFLHRHDQLKPWVRQVLDEGPDISSLEFSDNRSVVREYFLPGLGPIYRLNRHHAVFNNISGKLSGIHCKPFYIPANWKVKILGAPAGCETATRIRIRIFPFGGCSVSFSIQLYSKNGVPLEEFISFLDELVVEGHKCSLTFQVQKSKNPMNLAGVFQILFLTLCKGMFTELTAVMGEGCIHKFEPDFLLVDLVKTTPEIQHGVHDKEMAGVLHLNPNYAKLKPIPQEENVGIYEDDWFLCNSRCLVFTQSMDNWPLPKKYRWSIRRRSRLDWNFFKVAEFVRIEKLTLEYIADQFDKCTLEMIRAQNKSIDFLKKLFKCTFYDDQIVTFAYDLPLMRLEIYGTLEKLYQYMALAIGTDKAQTRFDKSLTAFLLQVNTWKPGVKNLLDFLKLVI